MNLSIGKKIGIGFACALAAVVAIGTVTYQNLAEMNVDAQWVTHTLEVQRKLEGLRAAVLQAESSVRGYQLLPESAFKDVFKAGTVSARENMGAIRRLTADNSTQQERLDRLEPLVADRLAALQRLVALRDSGTQNSDALRISLIGEGRQYMEQIFTLLNEMSDMEQSLLVNRQQTAGRTAQWTSATILNGSVAAFVLVGLAGFLVTRSITNPLRILSEGAARIGGGNYSHRVDIQSKDEVGDLASVFNAMATQVEDRQLSLSQQDWLKSGLAKFTAFFQGQRDPVVVCQSVLCELATLLDARHSLIYVSRKDREGTVLKLEAAYAADNPPLVIKAGEGLAGQCLAEKKRILLHDVPATYLKINSALGEAKPETLVVQPAMFEGNVMAVLELASWRRFTALELALIDQLTDSLGVVLNTIEAGLRTEELLKESQSLSENLQAQTARLRTSELRLQEQQEELKQTNEELEQTNEEMQQTNEEMEEKVKLLAEQKKELESANLEVEHARDALEDKARQVAQASKYKSDFLASMSHELRTPLNSLLILSKMLSDNSQENLDAKQVQYAQTIYSSGNDLLELINEILDLSKIESGAVEVDAQDMPFAELQQFVENTFNHVAETKKVGFSVDFDPHLPPSIRTDGRRLQQVLKNLLSNAFKFTEKGSVTLKVAPVKDGWSGMSETLNRASSVIAFSVTDTGIGIPPEKQQLIFEAFQQADAGTARKYGGTGLGLSISREIAALLGGSIQVTSVEGQGSTFTLYLADAVSSSPATAAERRKEYRTAHTAVSATPQSEVALPGLLEPDPDALPDDRALIKEGDLVLLIIEDDRNFVRVMMDFAREKKFKVLSARTAAQGMALAKQFNPSAITLDLRLPDADGWVVLDRLKHDPRTRHIPVRIISVDEERERSLRLGAISYFQKPVTKEILDDALNQTIQFINRPLKNLLIIEDDKVQRQSMVDLIGNGDVKSTAVGTAAEAFAVLEKIHFDCIVLDLGLPDKNGLELIREIHRKYGHHAPPIIVYTGKELSREEETELRMISDSIVLKSVRSPERLLDETALFLHRVQTKLPDSKRKIIEHAQKSDSVLSGRKVLVVDDDVRNIFAITSALEAFQMEVKYAESGQKGIDLLQASPDIEVVLMDVMMPEMDGFEAIRRIRKMDVFKKIPIISVTAKAMRGDREKCLEAGASDYITKPVDMDQLRSLLRVWLYR